MDHRQLLGSFLEGQLCSACELAVNFAWTTSPHRDQGWRGRSIGKAIMNRLPVWRGGRACT